ncbi:MAG TPA: YjgN family protein [Allosphingosinicella sp.]|jgi:uncharacterized membrane protein YjgN (DUF898 family)
MNNMRDMRADDTPASAFTFTGTWREFLPIALTNLLLTVVTLGIYRFWAKARERRYLWSRTHFIDDHLEWTGTGKEMFIGFLIVMLVLLPAFLGLQLVLQAMILRGETGAVMLLSLAFYAGIFYMIGVAQFRALRYRLSRTYWHGIRGGCDDGGWNYGLQYLWKTIVGFLVLGFLVPWSMTSLWNDRWNKMSFGQHRFEAGANTDGLFGRWLLVYLVPVVFGVIGFSALMSAVGSMNEPGGGAGSMATFVFAVLGFYVVFLLVSLGYYAAFYRKVVDTTSIAGLEFQFTARTMDWLKLILGSIALVIVTLGFGMLFVGYRNWSFVVRHMEAVGVVDLDTLLQSQTRATGDAEGLADAFDIGAI